MRVLISELGGGAFWYLSWVVAQDECKQAGSRLAPIVIGILARATFSTRRYDQDDEENDGPPDEPPLHPCCPPGALLGQCRR